MAVSPVSYEAWSCGSSLLAGVGGDKDGNPRPHPGVIGFKAESSNHTYCQECTARQEARLCGS